MVRTMNVLVVTVMIILGLGALVSAEEIRRSNWVPNVGLLDVDEQPLGDLWTFECPAGGTVTATVDTKDDTDTGRSNIDPILELFSGAGRLIASGDDEVACTNPPVCGFRCPQIMRAPCGETRLPHSLLVRDFGTAAVTNMPQCAGGGGYELTVEVFDSAGKPVAAETVHLGGGATRSVPAWALEDGKAPVGPALDDENVPLRSETEK
jgi:hypothetical protein